MRRAGRGAQVTPPRQWQVFISYAWQASYRFAGQLHAALADHGVAAFLDSEEISPGEPIQKRVLDALLSASVVVAFVNDVYFSRRYCVEEWTAALAAFRARVRDGANFAERADALSPVVLAVPVARGGPLIPHIPAELSDTVWPAVDETEQLVAIVRHRLIDQPMSIGERLERLGELDRLREWLHRPSAFRVAWDLPGSRQLTGAWEPDELERKAAWELYVELQSRVAVAGSPGMLREALASLHSLFNTTRQILRSYGPAIGQPKGGSDLCFGDLALSMLNEVLRPILSHWHVRLLDYESYRPSRIPPWEYEHRWEHADELKATLDELRRSLTSLADLLRRAAEVSKTRVVIETARSPGRAGKATRRASSRSRRSS